MSLYWETLMHQLENMRQRQSTWQNMDLENQNNRGALHLNFCVKMDKEIIEGIGM